MYGCDISLSIQTFEPLIEGHFIYVDKTGIIHKLLEPKKAAYFLSRPRRFGKSLTISTLDAIFTGKKHLFESLAISKTNYAWPVHPVVRLDMKYAAHPNLEDAKQGLANALDDSARRYDLHLDASLVEDRLKELIRLLHEKTRQKVVIVIDEYDKPLIDNLDNLGEARKIQGMLKGFYGILKSTDEFLRFVFITGVSKFTKVSVFSDLNHLTDLTLHPTYATLVGMTEEELLQNYLPYIQNIASAKNGTQAQVLEQIRYWYNGYRFSEADIKVYNPWSTLSLFNTGKFQEHWYTTGIPKMLVDIINRDKEGFSELNPADLDLTQVIEYNQFEAYDIENLQLMPLLIQTGFLTLKTYDEALNGYQLGYPNYEVRQAFSRMVLDTRLNRSDQTPYITANRIRLSLKAKKIEEVITHLNRLIASIPGNLHTPKESYYHSLIHMIFQTSGLNLRSEEWVAGGRIDTVIEEPDCFYIIEFKFGGTAEAAIEQIKNRRYLDKFNQDKKPINALGIAVDCETKSISAWFLVEMI